MELPENVKTAKTVHSFLNCNFMLLNLPMQGFVINSVLLLLVCCVEVMTIPCLFAFLCHFYCAMMCRCAWSDSFVECLRSISCHFKYYYKIKYERVDMSEVFL